MSPCFECQLIQGRTESKIRKGRSRYLLRLFCIMGEEKPDWQQEDQQDPFVRFVIYFQTFIQRLHQPFPFCQVVEKCGVERFGGVEQDVVDEAVAAFPAEAVDEVVHMVAVVGGDVPGFGGNAGAGFQIDKAGFAIEGQVAFSGVQNVEDNDLVFAVAKVFEPREQGVGVVEQIGEDDDEAAPFDAFGQVVEGNRQIGVGAFWGRGLEGGEQGVEVAFDGARGQVGADAVVEGDQADGVALAKHEVGQSGGCVGGVLKLGPIAGAIGHGGADVEQQVGFEVGFFFVLFDVEAVGFGKGLPVQVAQGVTGHVGAVFGELDRETVIGALVEACDEAFDDQAGDQVQTCKAGDGFGFEVIYGVHGFQVPSINRWMRSTAVTPSASALKLVTRRWRKTGTAANRTSSIEA